MALKTSPEGKICCNYCGTTLLVKTFRCPFRYCEQVAMCPACERQNLHRKTKAGHRALGCEAEASKLKAEQLSRQEIFSSGKYLLASTRRVGPELVHAIFRSESSKLGRFIPESIARRLEERTNLTLEDFEEALGLNLPEAPPEFDSSNMQSMLAVAESFYSKKQALLTTDKPAQSDQARLF